MSSKTWIIDSGATHHVSHDLALFSTISHDLNSSVTLPTGFNVKIADVGIIKLSDKVTLTNVLYIPDFRLNLLSISQLTRDLSSRVYFDEDSCVIQDRIKGLKIGQGKQIAGLYVLDTDFDLSENFQDSVNPFCSSVVVDVTL